MMQQKIDNLSALSKYRSELMGIAIIWIVLFHSNISAPDNFFLRVLWYLFVSFGGGIGVDIFFILSGFGLFYSVQFIDKEVVSCNWGGVDREAYEANITFIPYCSDTLLYFERRFLLIQSLSVEFFSERNQGFLVYTSHCNLLSVVSLILSNW